MAKRLTAKAAILYQNRQYRPGEELPATDAAYVSAWVAAGSAAWEDDSDGSETANAKKAAAKASLRTAPAGATGIARPAAGAEQDLVGKAPSKKARGVIKEPSRRPAKKEG